MTFDEIIKAGGKITEIEEDGDTNGVSGVLDVGTYGLAVLIDAGTFGGKTTNATMNNGKLS